MIVTDRPEPWHLRTRKFLRATDQRGELVRGARLLRKLVPGDDAPGDPLAPSTGRSSDRLARLLAEAGADRPSATRELGLAAVQAWQAATRRSGTRPRATTGITVLFTDLVGFSTWALHAGDDRVLELLRAVADVTESIVTGHRGSVVKGLGDGVMAVFADPGEAVNAAYETCSAVSVIKAEGYLPHLRAGLHRGNPQRVGDDYLGVDVNIAARIMAAADGDEVLASGSVVEELDADAVIVRPRRNFRAKGTPKDLQVYRVVPRYSAT
ncbi:adenylate/guanylate cyclase domain-containing protein [Amycolatopsis coloradensis]|uniref:Adenylate/guanylate cyclase domain-containing protein n=1 Tax=Amycolatopsis coloradensis TaxID=76021 RepID=A0A1R0KJ80_9PSEU|nr:adenylate/guanylate cyclase domain-containing protein [Amycolatopsis coloradensis]OLZ46103.1 adenylate/guanylate cyclase domain-containing protein [Amycolatopsis coloradensis]